MSDVNEIPIHFVCTPQQAAQLLAEHDAFYLRTCGCRERGQRHVDNNVCLWFSTQYLQENAYSKEITADDATTLLQRAQAEGWVIRPFRDFETHTIVTGICFCCACCCSYFKDGMQEKCEKGACIEQTDMAQCNDCGLCVPACLFRARSMQNGKLVVNRDHCYGCGICQEACPTEAIRMNSK